MPDSASRSANAICLRKVLLPIRKPTLYGDANVQKPNISDGSRNGEDVKVHHQRLLSRLGQKVADIRILKLIGRMLKARVVLPDGTRVSTEEGTPQGGPLSPLLSNVVLDEFDKEMARRGLRFVRYADDCNIFALSEWAGQRVMGSIRKFLQSHLRLLVNEEKSKVVWPDEIHFLGFRLRKVRERTKAEVHVSDRTKERMDTKIRELTPRMWGQSPTRCIERLNVYLRGWSGYFRIFTEENVCRLKCGMPASGDGCGPTSFGRRSDPVISTGTCSTAGRACLEPRIPSGADGACGIGATPRG